MGIGASPRALRPPAFGGQLKCRGVGVGNRGACSTVTPAVPRRANPARHFAGSCESLTGPTLSARPHSRSTHGAQRQIIVRLDMHTARHAATVNPSEGTPTIAH